MDGSGTWATSLGARGSRARDWRLSSSPAPATASRDRAASADPRPAVFLACLGSRRDFGGREMFTGALLGVAGIDRPSSEGGTPEEIAAKAVASGAKFVILCSSAKVYADQAVPVARALKDAGIKTVFIAGRKKEAASADVDEVIDGEVFDVTAAVGARARVVDRSGAVHLLVPTLGPGAEGAEPRIALEVYESVRVNGADEPNLLEVVPLPGVGEGTALVLSARRPMEVAVAGLRKLPPSAGAETPDSNLRPVECCIGCNGGVPRSLP